jgi:hypothetical protein
MIKLRFKKDFLEERLKLEKLTVSEFCDLSDATEFVIEHMPESEEIEKGIYTCCNCQKEINLDYEGTELIEDTHFLCKSCKINIIELLQILREQ